MNDINVNTVSKLELLKDNNDAELNCNDEANNANKNKQPKSMLELLKGYLLIIAYSFVISINDILLKMSFTLSATDSAIIRYLLQLITMFIIIKYKKLSLLGSPKDRMLLTIRALTGVGALFFVFFAVKLINPSDFKVINHSNIIFTAILARIFLKEKLTVVHFVTFCLSVVGVLFIAQPRFLFESHIQISVLNETVNATDSLIAINANSLITDKSLATTFGIIFTILAAATVGTSHVILKKLCNNNVHFSVATIYAAYYGLPLAIILSTALTLGGITHKEFKAKEIEYLPLHLLYTTIASFIGIFAQVLLNLALKYEDPTKLGIVKTIDVFFVFFLQYFLLSIKVNLFSLLGALSIILGAILLLLFKLFEAKLRHSRKLDLKFSFFKFFFYKF